MLGSQSVGAGVVRPVKLYSPWLPYSEDDLEGDHTGLMIFGLDLQDVAWACLEEARVGSGCPILSPPR